MRGVPVCVFARPPRAGEAKTRLGRVIGHERAARLAQAFLVDTWHLVTALPWARPVLAGTDDDVAAYGLGPVELWSQGEGDLGARMTRILERALRLAPRALLVGADVPGLPAEHLEAVLEGLSRHDIVLAPSEDGGFHLLGARRLAPRALEGVSWSTATTLAQTEAALARAGLTTARAARWFDVDVAGDLERLRELLQERPDAAPRTREALEA